MASVRAGSCLRIRVSASVRRGGVRGVCCVCVGFVCMWVGYLWVLGFLVEGRRRSADHKFAACRGFFCSMMSKPNGDETV